MASPLRSLNAAGEWARYTERAATLRLRPRTGSPAALRRVRLPRGTENTHPSAGYRTCRIPSPARAEASSPNVAVEGGAWPRAARQPAPQPGGHFGERCGDRAAPSGGCPAVSGRSPAMKSVFVTVGTTSFDDLIATVSSPAALQVRRRRAPPAALPGPSGLCAAPHPGACALGAVPPSPLSRRGCLRGGRRGYRGRFWGRRWGL